MNILAPSLSPMLRRRQFTLGLVGTLVAGCGGGSSPGYQGSVSGDSISSRSTGTDYPLSIYLPPQSAADASRLPIVYMLDGETWFQTLVGIVDATQRRVVIVGINTAGQRNRDFVPPNTCTANGGGQAAYFDFLRQELAPAMEARYGGDPTQRVLFGRSHGGSFALYAMFGEPPTARSFMAYLSVDASVGCMQADADSWNAQYAAAYTALPTRLHLSCATQGNYAANQNYAAEIAGEAYAGLSFATPAYGGTHAGIVPVALADGIVFATSAHA